MTENSADQFPLDAAALARENAELRAELAALRVRLAEAEGLADRDALTPLFNRRALMRELARTLAAAERYGGSASLVYFDLDGLKAINDRFGHAAGDAALKAVAQRLIARIRASDAAGRMGGDEFAVILAQTNGFQAEAKALALAQAIAAEPVEGLPPVVRLKVSWGVAEIRSGSTPDAVIAEADAAMYATRHARPGHDGGMGIRR
ncbi:MAG TPA: GGDEF domain-containing protein [Phenylobacterium sp.]|uniref:GGDEF domain-containing protein n=1 Tax=Phenylobacterium sp. TaxID=1871053 RepID=UPI002B48E187|nr:GGDEF domain-containing protein [Phenylobacterium sp.]HKR89164.1 GGDEF domain-containing protein [Phenylobacterium sp.]